METAPLWIDIDVAKAQLDIAIGAEGDSWTVANDDAGIATNPRQVRSFARATGQLAKPRPPERSARPVHPHRYVPT